MIDIEHSRVLIAGFGIEGVAAYKYLRGQSSAQALGIFEERRASELGLPEELVRELKADARTKWYQQCGGIDYASYDLLLKSPGMRLDHPVLSGAARHGLRVTSQAEILFDRVDKRRIVAVTGTKGKSTTVTLLAAMIRCSGLPVSLVGNIGVPVIPEIMTCDADAKIVAELSSYQLAPVGRSPHIAVLLGIALEHLDYHGNFAAYVDAKANIVRYQAADDFCIFNADSPVAAAVVESAASRKCPISIERALDAGAFVDGEKLVVRPTDADVWSLDVAQVPCEELPGRFNLYNVLAALAAAKLAGATREGALLALRGFKALPHRLRTVAVVDGVRYVDNSIATIPEATIAALETLGDRVQTLILGGFDRGVPYDGLARFVVLRSAVRNIALLPESGARIAALLETAAIEAGRALRIDCMDSMRAVAEFASKWTESGQICLLSPAAPSFGLFKNYEERGNAFRDEVLKAQNRSNPQETE